VKFVAQRVS